MPIILTGILIWFYLAQMKKKNQYQISLRDEKIMQQHLVISKQKALEAERNRIAGEMHDDLGGGLTTISYLSQRMKGKLPDEKSEEQLTKIINHAQVLVTNMSEIIWAMNSGFDTTENLIAYCRRYAREYLDTHDIKLLFVDRVTHRTTNLRGEVRRNVFLVCKEILHNVVKHAEASSVQFDFYETEGKMCINISDNGKGISDEKNRFGNGLTNIKQRIDKIDGKITWGNDLGAVFRLAIPLTPSE